MKKVEVRVSDKDWGLLEEMARVVGVGPGEYVGQIVEVRVVELRQELERLRRSG